MAGSDLMRDRIANMRCMCVFKHGAMMMTMMGAAMRMITRMVRRHNDGDDDGDGNVDDHMVLTWC